MDVEISELELPNPERVPRLTSKWEHYESAKWFVLFSAHLSFVKAVFKKDGWL